jgi:hypothetical protein
MNFVENELFMPEQQSKVVDKKLSANTKLWQGRTENGCMQGTQYG